MKLFLVYILLVLTNKNLYSQNLEGIWTGKSEKHLLMSNPKSINLELHKHNDSSYIGVLHTVYKNKYYEHIKITAKYKSSDSTLLIVEDSAIDFRKSYLEEVCLGKSILKIFETDTSIIMQGVWKDKQKGILKCPSLKIKYEKITKKIEIPKIEQRLKNVFKVIDISKTICDSIKLEIYDNGEIDGDSISLFLNENLIVKNLRLSNKPYITYLNLDKKIVLNNLTFRAINLGEIPPNTGYMIITTKINVYRIYLYSTLTKDGVVEFQIID